MEQGSTNVNIVSRTVQPQRQTIRNRVAFLEKRTPVYASVLGVLGILTLWEGLARIQVIPPLFLPSPSAILAAGWQMVTTGEVTDNILTSLMRIGTGYAIGAVAGIVIGLLLGFFRWVDSVLTPVIYSIYPIPKIALLPLFILWLGIGELPKFTIIALGVFFPVVINTYAGVKQVDPILLKAAVTFGSKYFSVIRKVILPAALPTIFAGLKLAAGNSLLLLVSAEMIAAEKGVGSMILHYGNLMMTTNLMVGVLILSMLGLLFNRSLEWLERKLLPWK
ncbi:MULTISPECIES: ABC transporter permease [Paenibacillus]|uniref:Nitrate ABC transporter permease n=1 Tax=Paenibacillus naphthalenovorans TaxID=162209 RepID=A0A0U2UNK7_9BACL|nr:MULTISPECIES: ABC transporter permease [Paenibacillus]ALS23569.1 nitrate ABC transporter permease [Paenibacillus naphthalenovorans]NTZ20667.1 ABC transporter permease [Paenibacillus sp. JMULE4]GCL74365.1 ABC transporter permease [Paenibacillus naphthalenovorans]SDJ01886.1 NitT/TauT family transport system permease protein [Paenibacillus naphthalenovorans]